MNAWCYLCLYAAWWGVGVADDECDVTVHGRAYEKDVLATAPEEDSPFEPTSLAVDFRTKTLYFKYFDGWYHSAKLDLESKVFTAIDELSGDCQFTVDQLRGYVHAGCRDNFDRLGGLYRWDSNPAQFVVMGEEKQDIVFVNFYNNTLYYGKDDNLLRTFVRGQSAIVPHSPSMWNFVVDAQGDLVFFNLTGVYRRRRGEATETKYVEIESEVCALAVDASSTPYVCGCGGRFGIWRLHEHAPATKLLDVWCNGLTFDADGNMIYSAQSAITRLVHSSTRRCSHGH